MGDLLEYKQNGGIHMQKEILLIGKRIDVEKSKVVLSYKPDEHWRQLWDAKLGNWYHENGWLIGSEPENRGGILLSKQRFDKDVMLSFTMASVLPATRDLNAVYCTTRADESNHLTKSYISGLHGWDDRQGGDSALHMAHVSGWYRVANRHNFLLVDGVLIQELIDNMDPISGGHVGFSPYSTILRIKDIEVREIYWEERVQSYDPEF